MLNLKDVTLIAPTTQNIALTCRAMNICLEQAKFGEVVICCPERPAGWQFRHEPIEPWITKNMGSRWTIQHMHEVVNTKFALAVEWDSWIINPSSWSDEFLEFDYIGAPWPWIKPPLDVGNGGFSLRSKKYLEAVSKLPGSDADSVVEDVFSCRTHYTNLKYQGIKIAPTEVAERFSYERGKNKRSFGFHGQYNMIHHIDRSEIVNFFRQAAPYVHGGHDFQELVNKYRKIGDHEIAEELINLKEHGPA